MRSLLAAGMYRLIRSKLMYLLLGLLVVMMTLVFMQQIPQTPGGPALDSAMEGDGVILLDVEQASPTHPLNFVFFQYVLANLVASSVFCSLFLGSEYGDGVLRNKLIVGRTRAQVYLANLVINALFSTAFTLVGVLTGLCVGVPMLGGFGETELSTLLVYGLLSLVAAWSFASIFTMISMTVTNRALSVAVCLVLAFAFYFLGQYLTITLSQPEFTTYMTMTEQGEWVNASAPNPSYVSGFTRQVYQFLYELTPGGQGFQIGTMQAETPWHLPVYAAGVILASTGAGLALFGRKDIK